MALSRALVYGSDRARSVTRLLLLALSKRLLQPPDRQLAGVKLTLSLNRRTVTVDTNRRFAIECRSDRHAPFTVVRGV